MSNWAITASGTTFDGNTSTIQPGVTQFAPAQNFTLTGILAIVPPGDTTNASGNGVNPVDIGLYIGNTLAITPAAGSLAWASNSGIHMAFLHANSSQKANVDDSIMTLDPATNTITAIVDPRLAPTIQLNQFDKTGGLLGFPSPILAGQMTATLSADDKTVSGTIDFFGGGFIEPTTTAYHATFVGSLLP
jgi:hypothetical protein